MAAALRSLVIAVLALCVVPAVATADTTVSSVGSNILTITPLGAGNDDITVSVSADGLNSLVSDPNPTLTAGTGCTGGATQVTCPLATSIAAELGDGNDKFRVASGVTVPVSVRGGAGTDELQGGPNDDVLAGGNDGDRLNGDGGVDDYFGGPGDDDIESFDRRAERVDCGGDANDRVHNDFVDVIAGCKLNRDGDGDGFDSNVDCDDANRAIFPGAREIFSNGIDENCNARDDVNLDIDGDGFPRPQDCNDSDPKIRPNAVEIRGNKVDENCDTVASPWVRMPAVVSNRWVVARGFTRLRALIVHNAPRGARVSLSCTGKSCPFRKTRRRTVVSSRSITLSRGITRARLRTGTRFRLVITARETIGRTYSFTVRRGELPSTTTVCRAPDETKGQAC